MIVLSRNAAATGLTVMRFIEQYWPPVTRAIFTQGRARLHYIPALGMSVFLTPHREDVVAAARAGHPAGHVLPRTPTTSRGCAARSLWPERPGDRAVCASSRLAQA